MSEGEKKKQADNENIQEFNRFLQNNTELFQDKYRQYFTLDEVPIQSIESRTIVRFISDIFSFDRYHDPSTTQKISKSLTENYQSFLRERNHVKQFNANIAIQLLKYSIQNNQLFAVKYETKEKQEGQNTNTKKPKKLVGSINQPRKEQQRPPQNEEIGNESPKTDDIHNKSQGSDLKNSFDLGENQFDDHQQIKLGFDPVLIKRNSKIMFDFYCKEQMSLAKNLPFDRLQRQYQMLTLNNFLIMAQLMNFYSSTLTKEILVKKFRRNSGGKNQINFDKFDNLFSELQIVDPALVARSELNSLKIHSKLRSKKLPFNTQDTSPREQVKHRAFKKKLTLHSGKMEEDLTDYINEHKKGKKSYIWKSKKDGDLSERYQRYESRLVNGNENEQIFSTKKLLERKRNVSSDLKVMNKIVTSQEDDEKWLNEYPIKVPDNSPPRYRQRSFQEQHARKQIIIEDLKKRIRELEKSNSKTDERETRAPPYPYMSNIRKSNISQKK